MKSFSVVLSVALASFAVAQDGLPDCAVSPKCLYTLP